MICVSAFIASIGLPIIAKVRVTRQNQAICSRRLRNISSSARAAFWSAVAMEKAYFDFRRRLPGKDEPAYLRLAFQSRYPEKDSNQVSALVSDCHNLEDIMVKAISVDFSPGIAAATRMNVLMNIPACVRCGKYRALSTTDDLCYGCRKYPAFSACNHCHLYWDDSPKFCQHCGGKLWRITDGPGVPMIPLETIGGQSLSQTSRAGQAPAI